MSLDKILSISGKPGLYQIVTQTRTGAVVESLIDKKRITVGAHSNISILSEIAIYTLAEEVPLRDVLKKVKEKDWQKTCSMMVHAVLRHITRFLGTQSSTSLSN